MKKILLMFGLSLLLIRCIDFDDSGSEHCYPGCLPTTPATIRDLTGLDGCGFVFEINDSTRLEPVRIFSCGTPANPDYVLIDPLANFEMIDGKKVLIDYTIIEGYASTCMVGPGIRINCIKEVSTEDPSE